MSKPAIDLAKHAAEIPPRARASNYPEPFAQSVAGREKRALGDAFGLANIGVNLTTLRPGAMTALLHRHSVADELVYVLEGRPVLVTEEGRQQLEPGMCVGFRAGGVGHHIRNDTADPVTLLEISDRLPGDEGVYPEDDLAATRDGEGWVFTRKDGTPY